jgi:hypothetical protein
MILAKVEVVAQSRMAAASLREGLSEILTTNRMNLPTSLRRSLGTTNIIESPHPRVRMKAA